MVTTRSKDSKRTALPDSADAGAGSKREVPPESNKSPPPKHQKKAEEKDGENEEPVKEYAPPRSHAMPRGHRTNTRPRREKSESKATEAKPEKDEKKPESKEAETKAETKETEAAPGDETATVQEKGLIYFFTRPRVSVEEPKSIADIARSFFVLRPTEGDKPPARDGQSRLCIVPKKVLPTSGRQRWIGFVEKGNEPWYKATGEDLEGREYETKTTGHRHVPDAIQVGEGMYAITKADRAANLVYILTEPKELGEVQVELGLKDRGYFTISTRNPVYPAPKGTGIQGGAEYPQEYVPYPFTRVG